VTSFPLHYGFQHAIQLIFRLLYFHLSPVVVKEFLVQFLGYSRLTSLFTTQSSAVTSVSGNSVLHLNTLYTLFNTIKQQVKPTINSHHVVSSQFLLVY